MPERTRKTKSMRVNGKLQIMLHSKYVASQRKLQTLPGLSLIGRAVKFKTKWAALRRNLHRNHFKLGAYSRIVPTFNRNCQASQRPRHFLQNQRDLRQKLRQEIIFLSGFVQFVFSNDCFLKKLRGLLMVGDRRHVQQTAHKKNSGRVITS
jgi:hypothetical protein